MSTPSDSIIEHWNRSFRPWSENYIKPFKSAIIENCLFENEELQKGHVSALRDIEKNKGNIRQFVEENTEQKYFHMLPDKILSDTYSFLPISHEYKMVHRSIIGRYIQWKPGTSNALSRAPLEIRYGNEDFMCKFRKYQLESMKKFIQATPGTKEIRGQWSVNLANDSMMVSFGNMDVVIVLKIGCIYDKLSIMYEENGILRKNSKIRKQTLKTSCWGLEKTKLCAVFANSIIIQENYSININADNVLSISPIIVYVKKNRINHLHYQQLKIFCGDICNIINLNKRPYHIENIIIPSLTNQNEQILREKYRNNLLNGNNKTNKGIKKNIKYIKTIKNEPKYYHNNNNNNKSIDDETEDEDVDIDNNNNNNDDEEDPFYPVKPKKNDNSHNINNNNNNNNNDEQEMDGFYPIKPHHKHHGKYSQYLRANKPTPIGSASPISLDVSTIQDAITNTNSNTNNYVSFGNDAYPTPNGLYTPQHPAYNIINDNNNNNNIDPFPLNNNFGDDPLLIAPNTMDSTPMNDTNNFIDDGFNWSLFGDNGLNSTTNGGISRYPSIATDFSTPFDHGFHSMNDNDNNDNRYNMELVDSTPLNNDNNNEFAFNDNNPLIPNLNHHDIPHHIMNNNINDNNNNINNDTVNEMQALRQQNDMLLQRIADQQRQIEFLTSQIGTIHSSQQYYPSSYHNNNSNINNHHRSRRNPLKRRRISSEAVLPPAA